MTIADIGRYALVTQATAGSGGSEPMSEVGQTEKSDRPPGRSVLPPETDIVGQVAEVRLVPLPEVGRPQRNMASCKNQARKLGTPFTPVWKTRRNIRARCAAVKKR